jgi:RNA polymerase sigma factor (sigma-70 family)
VEASALQAPPTLTEGSALQAPTALPETRVGMPAPLLRLRSDEQLVALFRAGHDEAFRAIHDRYHKRLFAYARQMLPARQDAEDALQDVFVRAYAGLRASDRQLALRAWLFRVAHNRCVDELRRPAPPPPEVLQLVRSSVRDPLAEIDMRESLRRLIDDIRRLPDQQRSTLLMRELAGMSYADISASMGISTAAVKSLLVRARLSLAQAAEARDTACVVIRGELVEAHDRGVRPNANARKHMRDCVGCKSFRRELRGVTRQLAATAPAIGPLGFLAKMLGFSGGAGGGAAGGATAGGGAAIITGGATASAGGLGLGASHLATLLVAAVATAGGAVEIQHTIIAPAHHSAHHRAGHRGTGRGVPSPAQPLPASVGTGASEIQAIAEVAQATASIAPSVAATPSAALGHAPKHKTLRPVGAGGAGMAPSTALPRLDGASTTSPPAAPAAPLSSGANAGTASSAPGNVTCGTTGPTGTTTATSSTSAASGPSPTTSSPTTASSGDSPSTASSCSPPAAPSSGTTSSSSAGSPSSSSSMPGSDSTNSGTDSGGTGPGSGSGTGSPSGGSSAWSK